VGDFVWERNAVEEGWDGMSGEAGVEWWNGMHDFRGCGGGRCGWFVRWCWSGRVWVAVVLYVMAGLGDGVWSAFDASMRAGSRC